MGLSAVRARLSIACSSVLCVLGRLCSRCLETFPRHWDGNLGVNSPQDSFRIQIVSGAKQLCYLPHAMPTPQETFPPIFLNLKPSNN
ncbi:hypothetical protein GDO86_006009 [Hymenochirus boettgeri]|uniref:Secreted protein n=1 Tax=Hymenochirus boettgeri TaxID=247094 RepID=A0A8T2JBR1_9PIPI|nr:hypothetical protein GDO86_006009 [Hymenochirus boettgeri]